jgi:superoxide dismutase, Cu-Zn family
MGKLSVVIGVVLGLSMPASGKGKAVTVQVKDAQGKDLGIVTIKPVGQGVSLKLDLHGLSPGVHAIHFHEKAKCDPPDFKSAGPHFNPDAKKHGLENPEGAHAGDMLNFTADAKGKVKSTIVNKGVTLGEDARSLYSNGGTALVIHAEADDMKSDPAGNAGGRIACGVIEK